MVLDVHKLALEIANDSASGLKLTPANANIQSEIGKSDCEMMLRCATVVQALTSQRGAESVQPQSFFPRAPLKVSRPLPL